MKWHLNFPIAPVDPPANYGDKILLAGTCFAENIGSLLTRNKFDLVINPHGVLYNPASIVHSLSACLDKKLYTGKDLFFHHGLWHSWDHHERFSHPDADMALHQMNTALEHASVQLMEADWLVLTWGSAGVYRLKKDNTIVGNCHKMPAADFEFSLMQPAEVIAVLDNFIHRLFQHNKKIKIIFTVSPVRYARRGLAENNLSKSILLYATHHLCRKFDRLYYFPAYEIVIDELRDYRFYEKDMVHPTAAAVEYVWERFTQSFLSDDAIRITEEIQPVLQAAEHRPFHKNTEDFAMFKKGQLKKIADLETKYPFLDFTKEKNHFS